MMVSRMRAMISWVRMKLFGSWIVTLPQRAMKIRCRRVQIVNDIPDIWEISRIVRVLFIFVIDFSCRFVVVQGSLLKRAP